MTAIAATLPAQQRLLDAAERLVAQDGAAHLTLEAVAKAAGVSKGGLLYHFPSKEALLAAMIDRHVLEIDARVRGACAAQGDGRDTTSARLSARVRTLLEVTPERRAVGAALLAAAAGNPALMAGARARYRDVVDECACMPCGYVRAALVLLAVDGLVLGELLHVSPYTAAERSELVGALLDAVDRCAEPL